MTAAVADGPAYVVTGVQLNGRGHVVRVRWYLAEGAVRAVADRTVPRPLTKETVVDTVEVVDKLLEADPVLPLFPGPQGARLGAVVKVHVEADGTELIEVDPVLPGRSLRDLPRL